MIILFCIHRADRMRKKVMEWKRILRWNERKKKWSDR